MKGPETATVMDLHSVTWEGNSKATEQIWTQNKKQLFSKSVLHGMKQDPVKESGGIYFLQQNPTMGQPSSLMGYFQPDHSDVSGDLLPFGTTSPSLHSTGWELPPIEIKTSPPQGALPTIFPLTSRKGLTLQHQG